MHYTLHRHYDPVLMRFTGPDPIASPFYNLHAYTGNSPARYFDPDGLRRGYNGIPRGHRLRLQAERTRHRLEAKLKKQVLAQKVRDRGNRRITSEKETEAGRLRIRFEDGESRFESFERSETVQPVWDSSRTAYSSSRGSFVHHEAHVVDHTHTINMGGKDRHVTFNFAFGTASTTTMSDGHVIGQTATATLLAGRTDLKFGGFEADLGLTVGEGTAGYTFGSHAIGAELGFSLVKLDGGLSFDTGCRHGPNGATKTVLGLDYSVEVGVGAGVNFDLQRGFSIRGAFLLGGSLTLRWGEFDPTIDD